MYLGFLQLNTLLLGSSLGFLRTWKHQTKINEQDNAQGWLFA